MRFASVLVASIFSTIASGSAWAFCSAFNGPCVNQYQPQPLIVPHYSPPAVYQQPQYSPPFSPSSPYYPYSAGRQLDQDLQNLNRALIYNGQRNPY
jgi:hypothetical protein